MTTPLVMMLCIGLFGPGNPMITGLPAEKITLSWTHSIERTGWQETWFVAQGGFLAGEARIKTGGSGMEPPEGSTLRAGWYYYTPEIGPVPEIVIPDSDFTAPMEICVDGRCSRLSRLARRSESDTRPIRLWPVPPGSDARSTCRQSQEPIEGS